MSVTQARKLRKATTPPERKLWAVIAVVRYRAADVYRDVEPVVIHILEMARPRTPPSGCACHLPRNCGRGDDCAASDATLAIHR